MKRLTIPIALTVLLVLGLAVSQEEPSMGGHEEHGAFSGLPPLHLTQIVGLGQIPEEDRHEKRHQSRESPGFHKAV